MVAKNATGTATPTTDASAATSPLASGGTASSIRVADVPYIVRRFNASGTLTLLEPAEVEYLVVGGGLTVSSTSATSPDSYKIEISSGSTWTTLAEAATGTSYTTTGLTNGTAYRFRITPTSGGLPGRAAESVAVAPRPAATGGTVTETTASGVTYRIHRFNSSSTFSLVEARNIEYLIVGGDEGGGGAGGYRFNGGRRPRYLPGATRSPSAPVTAAVRSTTEARAVRAARCSASRQPVEAVVELVSPARTPDSLDARAAAPAVKRSPSTRAAQGTRRRPHRAKATAAETAVPEQTATAPAVAAVAAVEPVQPAAPEPPRSVVTVEPVLPKAPAS